MKKTITLLYFFLFAGSVSYVRAQDLGIDSILAPVSGCALSATQTVTVVIKNYDALPFAGNVNISYKINAGAPVTATATLPPLPAGNTTNYSFTTTANLSSPGTYSFTSYTSLAGDVNLANDTAKGYAVTSYASTVGGTVSSSASVCSGASGKLILNGFTGTILKWQSSTNSFSTYNDLMVSSDTLPYSNLTVTTSYRAIVQSGTCTKDTSSIATLTIIPSPNGGTLSGIATVCATSNGGTITLTNQTGTIVRWEFSTDGGNSWTPIANTNTTNSYSNLSTTTTYRAVLQLGSCTSYSSEATITVSAPTIGGMVSASDTVCSGSNSGTLNLAGHTGGIVEWQYSSDGGGTWISITNTTTSQSYLNLSVTTQYRVVIQSGGCPQANSSIATITVDPKSVGGTVTSSTTVCTNINSGTLTLSNFTGNVVKWEYSTDSGINWLLIPNTGTTQNYLNLTTPTWYRAIVMSGVCSSDTSSVAVISIAPLPTADAGEDTSISLGYSIQLNGTGGTNYSWTPATGLNSPAVQNPLAAPSSTTTYSLTVTDANGCTNTDEVTVTVLSDYTFLFTNLITPNGDGKNDTWHIGNIEQYPLCKVTVFTMDNKEIFTASPYNNDWNGSYNGKDLPDGTYYFILECPEDGKKSNGYITILRNK